MLFYGSVDWIMDANQWASGGIIRSIGFGSAHLSHRGRGVILLEIAACDVQCRQKI
jgi:hypothetical protein